MWDGNRTMKINIDTYDEGKYKKVHCGYVQDGTFYREVTNKHYMVKYKGYGIQQDVLAKLLSLGVKKIEIKTQSGLMHKSKLTDWILKGKKSDEGNGLQVFLPVEKMEIVKN